AASKGFSNLSPPLAPGESRTFAWTGLKFAFDEQPSGEAFDICVISSFPNNGIDVDSSNDVSCTTFLVGTGQALKERMDLLVYPNPASTAVTLELVEPLPHPATWSLYDPFGREVRRVVLPARQQVAQTNLGGVPQGFYFWRLAMQGQALANGKLLVTKQ
ncbi:MAG: T9SS type A sorting domain-containing protein, partial [Saprospiraceae bacterium]|nr:T9SS type A sorting domain-containing protein [Saprospiraceae bacterium]